MDTVEIAIGDNLLIFPWIEELVRVNKSFIVKRGFEPPTKPWKFQASLLLYQLTQLTKNNNRFG